VSEGIISDGIEVYLGERLRSVRPLGGGCIGEVYGAELEDGTRLVAKVDPGGEANLDREAYMLGYLRHNSELPVPEVYHGSKTLLLMRFVEGSSTFSRGAERHAAELLARLHDITSETYGHERDTLIGSLDQPNPPTEGWTGFFRDHRLLYAAGVAHEAGRLPAKDVWRIERLAGRLDDLLGEPNPPALIHGDAWSANVLASGDRINAFLDPAIYHADPEMELAYISMFNSFGSRFFERYAELRPISEAFYETRRDLYVLYPLLIHVYFFGGGYVDSVRAVLRRFNV
jgi:fructosamine-3-kinase